MNSVEGLRGFTTFLILLGILTTGVLGFNYVSKPVTNVSEADEPLIEPLNITINNITESTATIEWATVDPTTPELRYSKMLDAKCLSNPADKSSDQCIYLELQPDQTSHRAELAGLEQETTYFFRIIVDDKIFPVDKNQSFRTAKLISTPVQEPENTQPEVIEEDFSGFGEVNIELPDRQVLGATDENVMEPVDPLSNIDEMVQEEFNEALIFNDLKYDFNQDGVVTMIDYPLFINFVMNYQD